MTDAARQRERYVIQPGAEQLFADMLGTGQQLPGGCTLGEGKIERTSVVATYACGAERVVLELVHPSVAPNRAVRTERLAVGVKSGTPPAGLLDAVADRIRAREAAFQWTAVGDQSGAGAQSRWPVAIATGVVVGILALWILRRIAAARRRSA